MFKFIKTIGCLSIIVLTVFFVVALFFGGGKIKEIGDKTTGIIKKAFHYVADKADSIHQWFLKKIEEFGKPLLPDEKRDINNKKH